MPNHTLVVCSVVLLSLITACGGGGNEGQSTDPVPSDVPPKVRQQYIDHYSPPAGQDVAVPWLTVIHDERSTEASRVEVDYLRVYCRNASGTQLINSYEYGTPFVFEGGLWQRRPLWFASGAAGALPYQQNASAGTASFTPSSSPTLTWHPWGPRSEVRRLAPNSDRCWMESRVLITGKALVQGGMDYYDNLSDLTPIEAGVSNWYTANSQWQEITLGKP